MAYRAHARAALRGISGNRPPKTVEWHRFALGVLRSFLEEQGITQIDEVEEID